MEVSEAAPSAAAAAAVEAEGGSGGKGSWYVLGERAVLVPYLREHVPRYHEWMQDPALLEATASEPLSLAQEFDVHRSWSLDPISSATHPSFYLPFFFQAFISTLSTAAMVGDVNIYMNDPDDMQLAEIEIMIAEHKSRGKGIGQEAILLMMAFAVDKYGIHTFRAKISESNMASLKLFRKLGFKDASYSAVFKEVWIVILNLTFAKNFTSYFKYISKKKNQSKLIVFSQVTLEAPADALPLRFPLTVGDW
ncbi:N-acetyltransferase 9-like protein [Dichanthelium oligosanthes]|uniref:N-acetyltransferase 9-like protein n=1 Tax=Dichanthelium oligosanthes TaxID=888268 RepID=A0A1E5ULG3_9POAL|nr:N-acetyltransferase 9-like protein [Dichanthelium oligosanthes]